MAFATCTYTITPITVMGDKRVHRVHFVISSYQVEGVRLTAAIAGLSILDCVMGIVVRTVVVNAPVGLVWNETTGAIVCHKTSAVDTDAGTVFNLDVLVMGS